MHHNPEKQTGKQPFDLGGPRLHILALVLFDIAAIHFSYFTALWLRFDMSYFAIRADFMDIFRNTITAYSLCSVALFYILRLYKSLWRFAGINEAVRTMFVSLGASMAYIVAIAIMGERMPISYYGVGFILQTTLVAGIRFAYRFGGYHAVINGSHLFVRTLPLDIRRRAGSINSCHIAHLHLQRHRIKIQRHITRSLRVLACP